MAVTPVPVTKLIVTFILSVFWGTFVLIKCLWDIARNGKDQFFYVKERKVRPQIMEDVTLGTHGSLKLSEVNIHYVSKGDDDKPLMLFVHGFPECWFSWRFQMQHFSDDYRVVAIDMRGYGESDKPTGIENYVIGKLTADIKEIIIALGYDKCTLVAHDWGGAVAAHFTIRNPEMVDKLILCNMPHPSAFEKVLQTSWKQFLKSWYMFFFQLPYLPEMVVRSHDYKMLENVFNGQKLPDVSRKTADANELEAYKYSIGQPGSLTAQINYYRAAMRYQAAKVTGGYQIKVPTLIIWGTHDTALSTSMVAASAQWIPDLKIQYIPTAGHWVQQQEPDKVNQYMQDFVKPSGQ